MSAEKPFHTAVAVWLKAQLTG